ncbi:unnamed protein product, partial [Didymodactylos carnosus]
CLSRWCTDLFDQFFMTDPCHCYLGEQLCCSRTSIGSFNNQTGMATLNCTQQLLQGMAPTCPAYPSRKLILIQSQLGYAAAMAATCVTYVVTYIWVSCMACCKK